MLPTALKVNRPTCLADLAFLGRALCGETSTDDATAADAFLRSIDDLTGAINIPRSLRELGVRREQIPQLVTGSSGNSMAGNPRDVSDVELAALLESIW
jgi:alcohol dehydrogenase class IV